MQITDIHDIQNRCFVIIRLHSLDQMKLKRCRVSDEEGVRLEVFDQILAKISYNPDLVHHGNLQWGKAPSYCGGILEFGLSRSSRLNMRCSKCKLTLESDLDLDSLKEAFFFLALKQMFPLIRACNYLDLNIFALQLNALDRKIGELGFLSVLANSFTGLTEEWPSRSVDIAFTLIPGMQAAHSFDGFDAWARYLFNIYQGIIQTCFKKGSRKCLGPKSV